MTIDVLYGTESGNAEMAAEEIVAALGDARAVDLQDIGPDDLDPTTVYLVLCSTYGDGELPASAQPFVDALHAQQPDLTGVRYAAFGLGDSSYAESYSLGGNQLAECLDALGAERFGDFGRHDASSSDDLVASAVAWAEAVLADAATAAA
ncbi:flavodoxin domain-containing protein [Nocardioides kongjuensis]|mgnify:CR=1 FL=1|uniref:MioC protein n=1 Tax=Nocardioides kongjuensis TaxID=349522 RepID=A0A852REK6_9ACTN|nr:flavodoxin domain-containing protein [Nocardioides kongjuensis]NYD28859.1 MioC protein [Nocardioides kongjuensis]